MSVDFKAESASPELDPVEVDEWQKCSDDADYPATGATGCYYVLVPQETGAFGLDAKAIGKHLTPEFLAQSKTAKEADLNLRPLYIDDAGQYFPDYLIVAGLDLVSQKFLRYLEYKFILEPYVYNPIFLVAKNGERIESYYLLIPETLDCLINTSYTSTGQLAYYEIDTFQTQGKELFRVKGFPYLIVTAKLNRIEFCGYQCPRIEAFFNYPTVREKEYRERMGKRPLIAAQNDYQAETAKLKQWSYFSGYTGMLARCNLGREIAAGLKNIFESYRGEPSALSTPSGAGLSFVLSAKRESLELSEDCRDFFSQWRIPLDGLQTVKEYLAQLPKSLKPAARRLFDETVFDHLCAGLKLLDAYGQIHGDQIFSVSLRIVGQKNANPLMVYHYYPRLQQQLMTKQNQSPPNLNGKSLWRYDFSGKRWPELKINGADLQGARFDGAQLAKAEFVNCDLTEATFRKADLKQAKFTNCKLRRTNLDRADLRGAELAGSDLYHCSFIRSNLREAKIKNQRFEKVYFEQANLFDAVFEVPGHLADGIFRLCDLRGAKFIGAPWQANSMIAGCDFRNSDLTGCRVEAHWISKSNFTMAKLSGVHFATCQLISMSNFQWSICNGIDFGEVDFQSNDFSFVNLSQMKTMKGATFVDNNFTRASLAGYSFRSGGYLYNKLVYTDLSNSNLEGVDFSGSYLVFPDFQGAILNDACFHKGQLPYIKNLTSLQRNVIVVDDVEEKKEKGED